MDNHGNAVTVVKQTNVLQPFQPNNWITMTWLHTLAGNKELFYVSDA